MHLKNLRQQGHDKPIKLRIERFCKTCLRMVGGFFFAPLNCQARKHP